MSMSRVTPFCVVVLVLFAPAGARPAPAAPSGGAAPSARSASEARRPAPHATTPAGTRTPAPRAPHAGGNLLRKPGFQGPLPGHPWMPGDWGTSESRFPSVVFG